ncbi:transcriptional xre family [Colletotrichum higginsianum]|nr:transcriptional xre family [Colletotrichum higginsianum]
MLETLSSTVTKMNRYLRLLPRSESLKDHVRSILDEFVSFCITAIEFYEKLRWYTPIKLIWKPLHEHFKQATAKITVCVNNFDQEASIAVDEVTVKGIQSIERRLHTPAAPPITTQSVFQVDFARNGFFTGRKTELGRVHEIFMSARRAGYQRACTVHSMAGVGKTQFALEYAYLFRKEFDFVFWLPAQHGPTLAQRFADIAKTTAQKGRRPSSTQLPGMTASIQQAKEGLEQCNGEWLLLYDNVEDWETIKPYWPTGQKGSILITTQNLELVQISEGYEISLTPLTADEGASLLLKHLRKMDNATNGEDFEIAKEISRTLGGLPVAISHNAGYIEKSQRSLSEFVRKYARVEESRHIWSKDCRSWTNQYERTLETTWDLALGELNREIRDLTNILAMLDPDSISEDMLFSGWDAKNASSVETPSFRKL